MILADLAAWIGMGLSISVFILLAAQRSGAPSTVESVLLAGRSATSRQFGASFVAASTSLATVLIFFINTSQLFGVALLWCGVSYLAGQAFFIWWMQRIRIETRDLTSNADFVLDQLNSRSAALAVAALTASAFLLILFLELYIGSEILAYYFGVAGPWGRAIAFFVLGAIVLGYVRMGGLRVVLRTDVWQYYLMITACAALLLFAVLVPVAAPVAGSVNASTIWGSATWIQTGLFMAWIALLNFTLPFTQLSSWQRLAATTSTAEAWRGLIRNVPGFLVVWALPVIALLVLNGKGWFAGSLSDLFDTLRTADENLSLPLYPIIFVGFASALFSTADTALIALQFSVSDRTTLLGRLTTLSESALKWRFLLTTIGVLLLLSAIFGLAEAKIGPWFMPLVYTIFSQLTIIAPQVIYAILERSGVVRNRDFTTASAVWNIGGIALAWLILIGSTVAVSTGIIAEPMGVQEGATYVATLVSTIGLLIGLAFARTSADPPIATEHEAGEMV